jgi:NADPH:quinone reductase-like Zn-dependent oxidoreductase
MVVEKGENIPMSQVEIPRLMRSLVCHGPHDYRLEEIEVPAIGSGEVLVRILGAGICAGDLKCYQGAPLFWGDEYRDGYCQPR